MPIELTRDQWKKFAPGCPPNYTDALFSSLDLLRSAGILDNELRWCHFIGTVHEETGDFKECRESLRYTTTKALRNTWPSRFGHKTDAELKPLLKNERALAEAVYGGRMGNRPGTSDAFDYRGGGFLQTTGRSAVANYCAKCGVEPHPGTLDDPLVTIKFAVLEWQESKCNQWADENDLRKVAKAINTGSANSNVVPVGLDHRRRSFARAWAIWGETGEASAPVSSEDIASKAKKYAAGAATAAAGVSQVPVKDVLEAARGKVDQAKQAREIVQDAGGFIPAALLKNTSAMVGVGAVLAIAAAIILIARKKA